MTVAHLSYSQLSSWQDCGQRFYLERVVKLPSLPSFAQCGGSAVHAATEAWDRWQYGDEGVDVDQPFSEHFEQALREQEERTGFSREEFKATGRKSKDWPEKENLAWWAHHGPIMVEAWKSWRRYSGWEIAFDGDTPCIEIEINLLLGGVTVKGYIDRVMAKPTGELVVVDLKSGREPAGAGQLGLYGLAVEETLGLPVDYGCFWMARTGMTSELWPLAGYTRARLEYEYGAVAQAKRDGIYLAHPSSFCGSCGVKDYCPAQDGPRASEIDQPWQVTKVTHDTKEIA